MRKFFARFRQAPMFSSVYILGAALSVASVMLVAIFLHVKTSNIYPEYSRDRILYCSKLSNAYLSDYHGEGGGVGSFTEKLAATIADSLKNKGKIFITKSDVKNINVYVDDKKFENVTMKIADPNIFSIYNYQFIEGKPFTDETAPEVVISDRLARRIFGTDQGVIGRKLIKKIFPSYIERTSQDNKEELTVCGVFKESSRLLPNSFAEIIAPLDMNYELLNAAYRYKAKSGVFLTGDMELVILPFDGVTREEIHEVIDTELAHITSQPYQYVKRKNYYDGKYQDPEVGIIEPGNFSLSIGTYPRSSMQMALGNPLDIDEKFSFIGLTKLYGLLILILLLVPALNLSSLISGNMDSKMNEMGIRKAFGARNSTLLRQIINENLWLTICGALLGVIFSWIGVQLWKEWLFAGVGKDGNNVLSSTDIILDPAMLFAPKVFIFAVAVCVILNLLSSIIPAWMALRHPAIDAIKAKS